MVNAPPPYFFLAPLCIPQFLTTYKFDLPVKPEYLDPLDHDFTVIAANDVIDEAAGTRSLTIVVKHPGIIWTSQ